MNKTKNSVPTAVHERIYYWDNAKLALIFLVVLGHFVLPVKSNSVFTKTTYYSIYLFHMPVFVFISGFFAKNYVRKPEKEKRLLGFLILYIVFQTAIWIIKCIFELKLSIFDPFVPNGAPWYMLAMFVWYLLLPFLSKFKPIILLPVLIALSLLSGLYSEIGETLSLSRIITFCPFFMLGYCFNGSALLNIRPFMRLISAVIFAVLILLYLYFRTRADIPYGSIVYGSESYSAIGLSSIQGVIARLVWYLVVTIVGAAFLCAIPNRKLAITFIGERTLAIYILHRLIRQVFVSSNLYRFMGNGVLLLAACIVVSAIALFACSLKPFNDLANKAFKLKLDRLTLKDE